MPTADQPRPQPDGARSVRVPRQRWNRWARNFGDRHGAVEYRERDGALTGTAADGSYFSARLPFGVDYRSAVPGVEDFSDRWPEPDRWGVLLVRKGGFGISLLEGGRERAGKVGSRHVQGRTKAGGQSQQRFARRRDNQSRDAYRAAADHAARVWDLLQPTETGLRVVAGGDRQAVEAVLADPRLRHVEVVGGWLDVPDPRRAVLDAAIEDARSALIEVVNA